MPISRSHFEPMATKFGLMLKEINFDSDPISHSKRLRVLEQCIASYCTVSNSDNSRFARGHFLEWIEDVAHGRRDDMGRKVIIKPPKVKKTTLQKPKKIMPTLTKKKAEIK